MKFIDAVNYSDLSTNFKIWSAPVLQNGVAGFVVVKFDECEWTVSDAEFSVVVVENEEAAFNLADEIMNDCEPLNKEEQAEVLSLDALGWDYLNKVEFEVGEDGFLTEECIKKMNMLQYGTENPTVEQIFEEVEDDD